MTSKQYVHEREKTYSKLIKCVYNNSIWSSVLLVLYFPTDFFLSCCRHLLSFSHERINEFYTDFGCKAWPVAGIPVHPKGAGAGVRIGVLCMPVKFFPNKPEKLFFSRIWLCAWGCVYIETENTATELEARFRLKVCCVVLMWKSMAYWSIPYVQKWSIIQVGVEHRT